MTTQVTIVYIPPRWMVKKNGEIRWPFQGYVDYMTKKTEKIFGNWRERL